MPAHGIKYYLKDFSEFKAKVFEIDSKLDDGSIMQGRFQTAGQFMLLYIDNQLTNMK